MYKKNNPVVSVRLNSDDENLIREIATSTGLSRSFIVRTIIEIFIDEMKNLHLQNIPVEILKLIMRKIAIDLIDRSSHA